MNCFTLGAELHGSEDRHAVQVLENPASSAEIRHGIDWHDQRVLLEGRGDPGAGIHARLQTKVRIGNFDFDRGRASRRIEHGRDACDAALERLTGKRVHLDLRAVAGFELLEIFLDDVDHETNPADVHDVDDRCVLRDERARIDRTLGDEAVDRRDDRRCSRD